MKTRNPCFMEKKYKPKLIVILGPTASGKTDLSIKLAKKFNGEVISADSRQVYKGMNIGSGKVTKKEMEGVPHYLLDVVSPKRKFTVAQYKKLAQKAIEKILKKGKIPILCGGTGLYISAIVNNLELPKAPPNRKLRKNLEKKSPKELFKIYKKLDPKGARYIDKQNKRRLIMAVEVSKITGRPFWEQRKKGTPIFDALQIGVKLDRNSLKEKIEKRTEKMLKAGLEKEVKNLVKKYDWRPALDSIGYCEWKEYLEGKKTKQQIKRGIILHTLQYAKRQMTWFKKHPAPSRQSGKRGANERIHWVENHQKTEKLVEKFLEK
jgi:tRNA dimethylallyltransferase